MLGWRPFPVWRILDPSLLNAVPTWYPCSPVAAPCWCTGRTPGEASPPRCSQGLSYKTAAPALKQQQRRRTVRNLFRENQSKNSQNKKVLLRERKRHTDRGVSSTPSVSRGGVPPRQDTPPPARSDGGGYLRWGTPWGQVWQRGGGGTWGGVPPWVLPSQVWQGHTWGGVLHQQGYPQARSEWGVTQGGVPPSRVPLARFDGGYLGWGTPRARSDRGYPRWSTPSRGTPPVRSDGGDTWGGVPPGQVWPQQGYPPPVWTWPGCQIRWVLPLYLSSLRSIVFFR